MGWFENSYRNLFFDFHTHSTATDVAKDFNAEAWADELVKANAQSVSMYAKCHYGWNYYRKGSIGWPHPNLPPGLDMLGEVVEACHKRDIRVVAYYNPIGFERLAVEKEDWCERDSLDRKTYRGASICLMSPALEEYIIPQLGEIAANYEIDGMCLDYNHARMCFCQHCRRRFREDTGLDLPLDSSSPNWRKFVQWKTLLYREIQRKLVDGIHKGRPEVEVNLNDAYVTANPERPPESVGFMFSDIAPYNVATYGSMMSRLWVTLGKPFAVMDQIQTKFMGYWGIKKDISLKQELATHIANGSRACLGYQMYPQFTVEPAVMATLGSALAFVKERENLCKEAKPVPYIAVCWSTRANVTHQPSLLADDTALRGLHKILTESGFHYNIVTDEDLEEKIYQYKTVIFPDQRYISPKLASAVRTFVNEGGAIIATYRTGTLDEELEPTGKSILEDVLGVSLEGEYFGHSGGPDTVVPAWGGMRMELSPHAYFEITEEKLKRDVLDMPILNYGNFAYAKPKNARVLAKLRDVYVRSDGHYLLCASPPREDTGYPAITVNQFGKGKAAYVCGDVFAGYLFDSEWNVKHIIRNLLDIVLPEKLVEIDGPNRVEVVLTERGDERIVHLINQDGDRPYTGAHVDAICMTEQIVPIHDIGLKVKYDREPKKVTLEPEGKELPWKMEKGMVSVRVPRLEIHSCVVIK